MDRTTFGGSHESFVALVRRAELSVAPRYRGNVEALGGDAILSASEGACLLRDEPADGRRNVVLCGGTGAGKSTVAAAYLLRILSHATKTGENSGIAAGARWMSSRTLAPAERPGGDWGCPAPLVEDAVAATVLVIDSFGDEWRDGPEEDAARRTQDLEDVLLRRRKKGLRAILTTPLTREDVAERYGVTVEQCVWEDALVVELPTGGGWWPLGGLPGGQRVG